MGIKIYFSGIIILSILISSCNKQLEIVDLMNKNDTNFPASEEDLESQLTAVYQSLAASSDLGLFQISELASDDRFGGGNTSDAIVHAYDQLLKSNEDMMYGPWRNNYAGIFRVNKFFESFDRIDDFSSEENKNRLLGEAHFLRALFYFDLVRIFGDVPLLLTSEKVNIPRTPAVEVYAQIAEDLNKAIELLPGVGFANADKNMLGHATKWAAQGYLARVFLFYTGFYKSDELPLAGGGAITRELVVSHLANCIQGSGHALANDFRELWPYTNSLTVEEYPYTKGKGLVWLDETGNNPETVFAIKYGTQAISNTIVGWGLRGQTNDANVFPFGPGWGWGPVNTRFVEQWMAEEPEDDLRISGSVLNIDDPAEGITMYEEGGWEGVEDTHRFGKKYIPINSWVSKNAWTVENFTIRMFGAVPGLYNNNLQDLVLLRFADILLMHSELTQTNTGLNLVRDRVGLGPIPYSFDVIVRERRHELAFEGLRFYDLLRWYGDDAGSIIDENQTGVPILNAKMPSKVADFQMTQRIKACKGFFPIPNTEIILSNGVLEQNEGWGAAAILGLKL